MAPKRFKHYLVEKIIKVRVLNGKIEYFIKWQDYPESDNSWEPESYVRDVPEKVVENLTARNRTDVMLPSIRSNKKNEKINERILVILKNLKTECERKSKEAQNAIGVDEYLKKAAELMDIEFEDPQTKMALQIAAKAREFAKVEILFGETYDGDVDKSTMRHSIIYKEFERFIQDAISKNSPTSSQTVQQTTVENNDLVDPVEPFIRKVKNKNCGHVYDYQSVIDSLAVKRRLKCPTVGCSSRTYIIEEDLEDLVESNE